MQNTSPNSVLRTIDISSEFDLLGYPSGGYLALLATRLMSERVEHPDVLTLHASFLGHPASGPAEVLIETIDVKKSLSRTTLLLSQQGEKTGFYVASFSDFARSGGLTHSFDDAPQVLTPYADCVPVSTLDLPGALSSFLRRFDMRLKPGCLGRPGPGQPAVVEGWIALADGTPTTLASLVLFADAFPPPIFNAVHPSQWGSVPTVEYNVHLKAAPCPGPVHGRFTVPALVKGYIEIDGVLHDSAGNLVAMSRQVAKFRGDLDSAGTAHAG
jgi:hypothetical protein